MSNNSTYWFGIVPLEWKISTIGSIYKCRNEKVNDTDYPPLSVAKIGVVPQLESVAKSDANDNRKMVKVNDFVINSRSDRKQSCGVSRLDGSVSLINIVLYTENQLTIIPKFTNILLKNSGFAEEFYKCGHGIVADLWTTRWQEMKNILLPIPPVDIQNKIVSFLDNKCSKIDELIALENQQIEKLKEYKLSLIKEIISKDYENSYPIKLKYLCESFNSNIAANVLTNNINHTKVYGASGFAGYIDAKGIPNEYIGIIKDGAGVGRANIYKSNTLILGTMAYIISKNHVDINWLKYVLISLELGQSIDKTTIPHIYFSEYGNKYVNFVDENKQYEIADFLNNKCNIVEHLIAKKQKKIEKLNEYKKSLIYEYVTGKKEVI